MSDNDLKTLAALLVRERHAVLARWREQLRQLPSAQSLDAPTLDDHIPAFLRELAIALLSAAGEVPADASVDSSPPAHGLQRFEDGFDIVEVVAEYSILRNCIHDLADNHGLNLQGAPFHAINRVLDSAIALAVSTFVTQRSSETQRRREEYLAFVAHDLRTPLGAIAMSAAVLEHKLAANGEIAGTGQMMKTLRRNVRQLEGLISKVLEENLNVQTDSGVNLACRVFDLWPLAESLVYDLQPVAAAENTRLINAVPAELLAYADASLLRRIFQNLIANAIKYSPQGEVSIGAAVIDDASGESEYAVECWVRDNGSGIRDGLLEKVFDKGETDSENAGGTGLGLAIVKTFVEAHGGTITVESKEGSGATFRFNLPGQRKTAD